MRLSSATKKSCICVLGMHRSGTSCLTGILQGYGVNLGQVHERNPFNKQGNRENPRVMALNDSVLAFNQGTWDQPVVVSEWNDAHRSERDSIIRELTSDADQNWGFKDPRTLLTFEFWSEGIEPTSKIGLIGTFRHPIRVAGSLAYRSRLTLDKSFSLWIAYNRRLLSMATRYGFALVNFDLEPADYLADASGKLSRLGLDPERATDAARFFNQSLRSQATQPIDPQINLPAEASDLYRQLLDLHAGP